MSTNTKDLRNVVLLGHSGSGKTTFIETMLYEGGAIKRRGTVEQHNTVSDNTDLGTRTRKYDFLTSNVRELEKKKINILDNPGFDDFVGEVIANLKVADTALIMVNAANLV